MTLGLNFPDVEALTAAFLTDVESGTTMPKMVAAKVPYRVIKRVGGAAVDPRFLDGPLVHVISLAATRDAAKALSVQGGRSLFAAWKAQTVAGSGGHIHSLTEQTGPTEYLGQTPDGVYRFDATYRIDVRP